MGAADDRLGVSGVVDATYRVERSRILATLIRVVGDFELAEDVIQEVVADALVRWESDGVPDAPAAWLTTAARNRAIDVVRRRSSFAGKAELIRALQELTPAHAVPSEEANGIHDDRLRLMFTCCHPALSLEAQVALTLHTLGGRETEEIARAFLVATPTLAQRLVRAKRKIKQAGIPYRVPASALLPERSEAVRAVLYLIFNQGYSRSDGAGRERARLCEEAVRLGRLLLEALPADGENAGLVALMLLHHARREARQDDDSTIVLLSDQDRTLWKQEETAAGSHLVERALNGGRAGP